MVAVAAPADNAELYERYYPYIVNLLRQRRVPDQEVEDVASDIMTKLVERDIIAMFNPEHQIVHRGEHVPANFTTFLTNMVLLYTRGKRERLAKRSQREIPVDRWDDSERDFSIDTIAGADSRESDRLWDDYSHLAAEEFITQTRAYLAAIPRRSVRDQCDLVALFNEMAAQGLQHGHVDLAVISEKFHISATSVYQWVARLRDVLKMVREGEPVPPPRLWRIPCAEVDLSEDEIREAIHALAHQGKQPMVAQPLRKIGHKLQAQAADPRWYHQFAAEERAAYPGLETGPATHKKPAGHVRDAVVHRLERILAGGGEGPWAPQKATALPAPEPPTPAEELEAELWRLGAPPAKVDQIMSLAQKAFT